MHCEPFIKNTCSIMKIAFLTLCFGVQAAIGAIIINEIMINPTKAEDRRGEWFELYNSGNATVNLKRWTFRDDFVDYFRIRSNLFISPGGFLVLGNGNNTRTNGNLTVSYVYSSRRMSFRSRDQLVVFNANGKSVDRVNWAKRGFSKRVGASLALKAFNLNNNVGTNWCISTTRYGLGDFGTPGKVNDCVVRPPTAPAAPPVAPMAPQAPVAPPSNATAPVAPKAPVAPLAPVAPPSNATVPSAPVGNGTAPSAPVSPPSNATSPVAPSGNATAPSAPTAPVAPVAPTAPLAPAAPVAPSAPVAPAAPKAPAAPSAPTTNGTAPVAAPTNTTNTTRI
jgi:Lamin Tail Domain